MSINGDTCVVSSKQLKSVKPIVYKVSGCNDDGNRTLDCPTEGNISIDTFNLNKDYKFELLFPLLKLFFVVNVLT